MISMVVTIVIIIIIITRGQRCRRAVRRWLLHGRTSAGLELGAALYQGLPE